MDDNIEQLASAYAEAHRAVEPSERALKDAVREAQAKVYAFARANGLLHSDWEYAWFAQAEGVSFTAHDVDERGISVEYSIGQEYPTEDFLPFEFLNHVERHLLDAAQHQRDKRAFEARTQKARKRAGLLAELAALDESD